MSKKRTKQIYRKLFTVYTFVILCIVLILEIFFITSILRQLREDNIRYNKLLVENAADYISKLVDTTDIINRDLYGSASEFRDIVFFMESNTQEDYIKKKLDAYVNSESIYYHGMEYFSARSMALNSHINSISFISYSQGMIVTYNVSGSQGIRVNIFDRNEDDDITKIIGGFDNKLSYFREVNNPNTYENVGRILITYDSDGFRQAYEHYENSELLVMSKDGKIIYNSDDRDFSQKLASGFSVDKSIESLERNHNIFANYMESNDIYIIGYVNKNQAHEMSTFLWVGLISIGILLFITGEFFVHFHLIQLTARVDNILNAMEKVTKGDFTHIQIGKPKDELDVIGQYFNQMCTDLDAYIQQNYLLEIEQKNAEMAALQSQINPHFLYNTLEAIRMKAICNGDKEVGKMLYSLAVIFRSQVKEENIITVAKELHYCKKYLELFEFRYPNKFSFEMECNLGRLDKAIIKFILQPIIENYFIHGIRTEDDDNLLKITIQQENDDLLIVVADNGKGMKEEEIAKKNKALREYQENSNSIGLFNVQRRIDAYYGKGYGILLEKNNLKGMIFTLRFPMKEKSDV